MDSRRSSVLARAAVAACLLTSAATSVAVAQVGNDSRSPSQVANFLHDVHVTRVVDPKLDGGDMQVDYLLDQPKDLYVVTITVVRNITGAVVATPFSGREHGGTTALVHHWNGRDTTGAYVDPAQYTVTVAAMNLITLARRSVDSALTVSRLGIRNIAFQSSATTGTNEWQTVYFRKNGTYAFYATPASGEWLSKNDGTADVSDLDLNDSSPRPAPTVHTKTDEPVLDPLPSGGKKYDDHYHNYPICYLAGAAPRMVVTFGNNATLANGTKSGCKYPIAGVDLRCVASDDAGDWTTTSTSIAPGGTETLDGPALPTQATRTKRRIDFHWQYQVANSGTWVDVPGKFSTPIRFYTILDQPYWASGASGTQYSGPWVEVLEYLYDFSTALNVTCNTSDDVVEAFIQGFFGQQGSLTTAIEGVEYDCPSNGGDGGATHYANSNYTTLHLSKLLNNHDLGIYVNCTDCACSTSTMLSMLGVANYQLDHLGSMTLEAIWGIGCPGYTLDLWGGGNNSFSYHHIITRDGGTTISDACLCVDEDGDPDTLPGTPGYNNDRDWNNYESLVAEGAVTWYTEKMPKID